MKRVYLTTIATALLVLLAFSFIYNVWDTEPEIRVLKVGFIYENDESAPYTYNFVLAQEALEKALPDRVQVMAKSNVLAAEAEEPMRELAQNGCGIIFTNCYTEQARAVAEAFPDVQVCQVSFAKLDVSDAPANYHTFNGRIYQGFYAGGVAAGMKLRELIDSGAIRPEEAKVGFVGAYITTDLCSDSVAFLLGVRSVAPEATMKVRCTHSYGSYSREKACAQRLIDEGCIVISQHTHTIAPAVACEEAAGQRKVYHVGFNQDMIDAAPTTSLISARINWTPYVTGAAEAVLAHQSIEKRVDGEANGNDISAGIERGWVELLELNKPIAAPGTQEALDRVLDAFRRGKLDVFRGEYTCVSPDDPEDTYDLRQGFNENEKSSFPAFHYVLKDVMEVVR